MSRGKRVSTQNRRPKVRHRCPWELLSPTGKVYEGSGKKGGVPVVSTKGVCSGKDSSGVSSSDLGHTLPSSTVFQAGEKYLQCLLNEVSSKPGQCPGRRGDWHRPL